MEADWGTLSFTPQENLLVILYFSNPQYSGRDT